jgi:capsule biosynthesis phosphatase
MDSSRTSIPWNNTIVVDIDDTISTHVDRDYENAIPHTDMIEKLNKMYEMNYRIIYFTARGQLSCKGDLELINQQKRPTLEKWLEKNNVKYDELKFGKPLGLWYIDDKALRPEEFLELQIEELQGGSGATVRREGDSVIKECDNALNQAIWYRKANGYVNTPALHSIIENTLKIDYIEGMAGTDINRKWHIDKVIQEVQKIKLIPEENIPDFHTYIYRIASHLNHPAANNLCQDVKENIILILNRYSEIFNSQKSFCHGDLTLGNIIIKGKLVRDAEAFVFDPNTPDCIWMSYLLDLSKINQSLRFNYEHNFMGKENIYNPELCEYFNKKVKEIWGNKVYKLVLILEMTHWVRMIKYKTESERPQIYENIRTLMGTILNEK